MSAWLAATWTSQWDAAMLTARRHALYLARQARTRDNMRRFDLAVLRLINPAHLFYAAGARNLALFTARTSAHYRLIRPSAGLSFVSAGGRVRAASKRFAAEIAGVPFALAPVRLYNRFRLSLRIDVLPGGCHAHACRQPHARVLRNQRRRAAARFHSRSRLQHP